MQLVSIINTKMITIIIPIMNTVMITKKRIHNNKIMKDTWGGVCMELIGKGATAEVYAYGENKVCKLYNTGFPKSAVEKEYKNAILLQKGLLPIPKVYDMVEIEGRDGIIYNRINGRDGLDLLMIDGEMNSVIRKLAELHKKILAIHTTECINYKTFLCQLIREDALDYKELVDRINQLPDGDYLCHGDFHPGNLLFEQDGKITIIDFMNVCYGPREYDIARTYFLLGCGELPEDMPNKDEIQKVRKCMAELYLDAMQVKLEDIQEYISVIRDCRHYEMGN